MFDHDFEANPELSNVQLEVLRFVSPHVQIEESFEAVVVKVHDGDTVTLRTSFRDFDFPLRLANIDAPELSEGGIYAREYLKNIVLDKTVQIIISSDNRVGKYGRLIGELFFGGLSLGDEMLRLAIVKPFGKKNEGGIASFDKLMLEGEI